MDLHGANSPKLGQRLSHDLPPWEMPPAEQAACKQAWSLHFQPLMRELNYLFTCIPSAFGRKPSLDLGSPLQSSHWDSREYCRTLMETVTFLEHHKCWQTLNALLVHAEESVQVRLCFQGEVLQGSCGSLEPSALKSLLNGASHDDISIQCLSDHNHSSSFLPMSLPQLDETGACFEDALALRFEDWADKWWVEAPHEPEALHEPEAALKDQREASTALKGALRGAATLTSTHRPLSGCQWFSWENLLALACCVFIVVLAMCRAV